MTNLRNNIGAMFDPEGFRTFGHQLIDLLAAHLASNLAGQGKEIGRAHV